MKNIIAALATILLFIACGRNEQKSAQSISDVKMEESKGDLQRLSNEGIDDKQIPPQAKQVKNKQQQQPVPVENENWDKKIIRTASLNLTVKDFKNYNLSFRDKIKQIGGYVAQEEQEESEYKIENRLTIKVPVDQFENAVDLLVNGVEKLNEKKVTSQDVTTEFVDTRSRLESKKHVRLRYLDLLKQARNMEEILNVQSEINGIQEEIESASGRIEYLSHTASFSTINLIFYQVINPTAIHEGKPTFSTKFSAAFKEGWNWIQEVFIVTVSIWPLLLTIFAIYVVYRKTKRTKIKTA